MNIWDILILLLVGLMVYLAVRAIRSGRGSCRCGGCDHNCAGCTQSCRCKEKTENDRS